MGIVHEATKRLSIRLTIYRVGSGGEREKNGKMDVKNERNEYGGGAMVLIVTRRPW